MPNEIRQTSRAAAQLGALLVELTEEYAVISKGSTPSEISQMRMRIRTMFAILEAVIYVWKQMALEYHPDPNCAVFTQAERLFAQEQEYCLSDKGVVGTRRAKVSLKTNVRFAYKMLAKSGSVNSELDVSGSEWQAFQKAIDVRDRITHPKNISDLNVTIEEHNAVTAAFGWLLVTFAKLHTKMVKQAQRNLQNNN